MKFSIHTLGCKVNTYESEALTSNLENNGLSLTLDDNLADIIIVNSCTVTETSDSKSRKLIRRFSEKYPDKIIIVMGCYSQLNKEDASKYANIVLGTNNRLNTYNLIMSYINTKKDIVEIDELFKNKSFEDMKIDRLSKHTRGFIKIQDGCENFCAYCAIPYSRGPIRSRKPESVIEEIKKLDVKEVILSGINTGTYGKDLENINLAKLIEKICLETNINRIRLSSIELMEVTDELINTLKKYENRIAMQLHIPLQAGCDNTLKRMNRKYLTNEYKEKITDIRKIFPNISITTDCLAGYVGETEEDFNDALKFIEELQFARMHVFPYSRRKNTKADYLEGHLNPKIIHERTQKLLELANNMKIAYDLLFLNTTQEVLFERIKDGYYIGHSSNYLEVKLKKDITNKNIINTIQKVKLIKYNKENNIFEGE